jgi:hypothetical protein
MLILYEISYSTRANTSNITTSTTNNSTTTTNNSNNNNINNNTEVIIFRILGVPMIN